MKRNIIITIAIAVLIVLSISVFLVFRRSSQTTQQNNIQAKQQSQLIPVLPSFSNADILSVQNSNNPSEIKNQFQSSTNENISPETQKENIKWILFADKNSKPIPLDNFLKANGSKISTKIEGFLDKSNYQTFYCPNDKGGKDFGIALYVNPGGFYPNRYNDIMMNLKEWERTILPDFYSIIFPDTNFSEGDLQQRLLFKDGKYRYVELTLPDGQKSSINYENFGDVVVIAASAGCLDKVSSILEPLEP